MENIHVLCSYILIGVLTFNNLKKIKWKWKSSNINSHFSSFFHSFSHSLVHSFIHSSFISIILGKFHIGKYMYSTHNNNNNITASIPTAISCSNSYFYDGEKSHIVLVFSSRPHSNHNHTMNKEITTRLDFLFDSLRLGVLC